MLRQETNIFARQDQECGSFNIGDVRDQRAVIYNRIRKFLVTEECPNHFVCPANCLYDFLGIFGAGKLVFTLAYQNIAFDVKWIVLETGQATIGDADSQIDTAV